MMSLAVKGMMTRVVMNRYNFYGCLLIRKICIVVRESGFEVVVVWMLMRLLNEERRGAAERKEALIKAGRALPTRPTDRKSQQQRHLP